VYAALSARRVRAVLTGFLLVPGLTLAVAAFWAGPVMATGAAPPAAPRASGPLTAPSCGFGGYGGQPGTEPGLSDPSIVARIGGLNSAAMPSPGGIVSDAGDPRGRVFVTNLTSGTLSVIDGRSSSPGDIRVETSIHVGIFPAYAAIDPSNGYVFVSLSGECRVAVVDGRAATPSVIASIATPSNPSGVAFDAASGRLFIAMPLVNDVMVVDRNLRTVATLAVGLEPTTVAADPATGHVYVGCFGSGGSATTAPQDSSIQVLDARSTPPRVFQSEYGVQYASGFATDSTTSTMFVVLDTAGLVAAYSVGSGGQISQTRVYDADPSAASAGRPAGALLLPASHELLVTLFGSDRASLFAIAADGTLTFDRYVVGLAGGANAALDPATGRAFVAEQAINEVAVVTLDQPTAPAPAIQYVLPGPLDISLAPEDIARSIGITAFLMLLLGAPSTVFNSTLSANRVLIERWVRRKRPRRLRRLGPLGRIGAAIDAWSRSWAGLISYLAIAAVVYAFLKPEFPSQDAARTLFTTAFGIAVGTAVSQLPSEWYVRRHHGKRGRVQVALWTLGLALGCVLVTRLTSVQPGYIYGIIGAFAFAVTLTKDDRGRMAFTGMAALLGVGVAAWFVRIPFEPVSGAVGGDLGSLVNELLTSTFVGAVQGTAIALIPLRYLTGEHLFAWSRPRWVILWAAALLLFAHVILYPVSSFGPHPSPTGLWTVAATVVAYSAVAVGFWWFFRRRERRKLRRRSRDESLTPKASPA
jgi:DNA-binding beta-propeller fold protein YncE